MLGRKVTPPRVFRIAKAGILPPSFVCAMFCVLLAGCSLSPMARHAAAFCSASSLVIDNSEDAYRAANDLREREQLEASAYSYDSDPHWSPYRDFKPLLTPEQLGARIKVLDGLKAYAESLVDLTGKPSKEDTAALQGAATGVGTNLTGLSGTVSTSFDKALPTLSSAEAKFVSTAMVALGEYLENRKIKNSLPKVTQDMNKNVQTLCTLLKGDVTVLRRQADVDYTTLIEQQNQLLQHNKDKLDAVEKRNEVENLIRVAYQQKANDRLLAQLQDAIEKLALTHQALAAAAQGNNPEALKEKIAELSDAGKSLSSFYKSLPR